MSTQSHIAAIILAAGESSRLGQPKQLIQFQSKTLVRRVVDAASEAGCQPILVVLGSETETELVQGISSELKNTGATIISNQPFVDRAVLDGLMTLYHETLKPIVAASYAGTLGVPALFDRSRLQDLLGLDDFAGAKSIILSNRDQVAEFPFPEGEIDIDTAEDRERFCVTSDSQVENQSLTD